MNKLTIIVVAACFAAIGATPATAAPPTYPTEGRPGIITVVSFAKDGKTILNVKKFRGSNQGGSGHVDKDGAISVYDDEGRPGKPVRYQASQSRLTPEQTARMNRQIQAAKKRMECCSWAGCDWIDATREVWGMTGWLFGSWDWIGTLHHEAYFCWTDDRINHWDPGCREELAWTTNSDGCHGYGWFYYWRGDERGGHYSFRQGDWNASVTFFVNYDPWIQLWINGNGAWAYEQGGG